MSDSIPQVIYHLRQSITSGRWGYRPGDVKNGCTLLDSETLEPVDKEISQSMKPYTFNDIPDELVDTAPDGISLSVDFVDMSRAEFLQAFEEQYGKAPAKTLVFQGGVDEESGEPIMLVPSDAQSQRLCLSL